MFMSLYFRCSWTAYMNMFMNNTSLIESLHNRIKSIVISDQFIFLLSISFNQLNCFTCTHLHISHNSIQCFSVTKSHNQATHHLNFIISLIYIQHSQRINTITTAHKPQNYHQDVLFCSWTCSWTMYMNSVMYMFMNTDAFSIKNIFLDTKPIVHEIVYEHVRAHCSCKLTGAWSLSWTNTYVSYTSNIRIICSVDLTNFFHLWSTCLIFMIIRDKHIKHIFQNSFQLQMLRHDLQPQLPPFFSFSPHHLWFLIAWFTIYVYFTYVQFPSVLFTHITVKNKFFLEMSFSHNISPVYVLSVFVISNQHDQSSFFQSSSIIHKQHIFSISQLSFILCSVITM